jgi:tripartite motif-containing protein 71
MKVDEFSFLIMAILLMDLCVPVCDSAIIAPYTFAWAQPPGTSVHPVGIAADSSGNVYVSDGSNASLLKFSPDGTLLFQWGSQGSSPGSFYHPNGVSVNSSGYVYVADADNNRIQVFTPGGAFLQAWNKSGGGSGSGNGEFHSPADAAANSSGYVYVADTYNHRIQLFTASGGFVRMWNRSGGGSGNGTGEFDRPYGVAVNSSGYVYVADTYNHRIQLFTASGGFVRMWNKSGGGSGNANGEFSNPQGIAINSSGYVYVADSANNRIQVFTPDGVYVTKFGSYGSGNGKFRNPLNLAVNSTNYVYVVDFGNYRIQVFDPNGNYAGQWGSGGNGNGEFNQPKGIAINGSGYVYVADTMNERIQVLSTDGGFYGAWGSSGSGTGQLNSSAGIATNSTGYVYVADTSNHRIQVFTPGGGFVQAWNKSGGGSGNGTGEFNAPGDIAVNSSGYVYVADTLNNRIQVLGPDGGFLQAWGKAGWKTGSGNGEFYYPQGVTTNSSGYVYVADTNNHRIQVFTPGGVFVRAWNKSGGGSGNGTGEFDSPRGIAISGNGNVFVADRGNNRIQLFTPDGEYTGEWGSGGFGPGDLLGPSGIDTDPDGSVYVADTSNNRVQKFTRSGNPARIGVVRNNNSWLLDASGNGAYGPGDLSYTFGKAGDVPVSGDWDGDGATEIGVVRNNRTWLLDASGNGAYGPGDLSYTFGKAGDVPVSGDWRMGRATCRIRSGKPAMSR